MGNSPAVRSLALATCPCSEAMQPQVTPTLPDSLMSPHQALEPAVECTSPAGVMNYFTAVNGSDGYTPAKEASCAILTGDLG